MTGKIIERNPLPLEVAAALINVKNRVNSPVLTFQKFARNQTIEQVSQFISTAGGTRTVAQSGDVVRIKAGGDANDDASGTGAREVKISGINSSSLLLDQDILATAGVLASAPTSKSFIRVIEATVSNSGTYQQNNEGQMVIEDGGGNADVISIEPGNGSSQFGAFSTPKDFVALIANINFYVDTVQSVQIEAFISEDFLNTVSPFIAKRMLGSWPGVAGDFPVRAAVYVMPPLSDFWFEAAGKTGMNAISASWDVYLVQVFPP